MGKNSTGRVIVSTLPNNAPNWLVVLYLIKYAAFPNQDKSSNLEHLVVRPIVNTSKVFLAVMFYLFFPSAVALFLVVFFEFDLFHAFYSILLYAIALCFFKRKAIAIYAIRIYQIRANAEVRLRCKMHPSCSEFMIECIHKNGLLKGIKKGIHRVKVCGDPV